MPGINSYIQPGTLPPSAGSAGIFSGAVTSGDLSPNVVNSGTVASGSVFGFYGPVRNITSGSLGGFDFGSGAVIAGVIGSGAVLSGNIASGQIASGHMASGFVANLGGSVASGTIGPNQLTGGKRRVATDFLVSGTSLTAIPGLLVQLASGLPYRFELNAFVSGSTAGGVAFAFDAGNVTATSVQYSWNPTGIDGGNASFAFAALVSGAIRNAVLNSGGAAVQGSYNNFNVNAVGSLLTTAAGTFGPRMSEVAATESITILAGSTMTVEQVI